MALTNGRFPGILAFMKNALTLALTAVFALAALSGCCTAKKKCCATKTSCCATKGLSK
jgi:hypothetical protein